MQFIKTHIKIIVSVGIILTIILITFNTWSPNQKQVETPYEEKFPPLREIDFGEDIKGKSVPVGGGWSLYENEVFGLEIEYPSERKARERFYNSPTVGASYAINLSGGEFEIIDISITPSRFHTIEEWLQNDPEYQDHAQNYVFVKRKISELDAVTKYFVPEFIPISYHNPSPTQFTDAQLQRSTYVIKDDIMYIISTRDIPSEEYERVWSSFKFITD